MTAKKFLLLAMLSLPVAHPLIAQTATSSSQSAILRGSVNSAAGQPLVYALVSIPSLNLQQFSNQEGKFYFVQLPPGKYTVSFRQLGYVAVSREVVLAPGASEVVDIRMERIVAKLATMRVSGEWACSKPGRPMADSLRPLIQVFEQIEQHALRLKLLAEEYPFDFLSERKVVLLRADGSEHLDKLDSVREKSSTTARYKPGNVVQRITRLGRQEHYLQVPTLLDFADAAFQRNHCFALRGTTSSSDQSEIRVDFLPSAKLKDADVGGSVFLAAGSFRLLRAEIYLTKIPAGLQGLVAIRATTHFEDIVQGMPAISEIIARSDFRGTSGPPPYLHSIEHQKTLQVRFLKTKPADVSQRDSVGGLINR